LNYIRPRAKKRGNVTALLKAASVLQLNSPVIDDRSLTVMAATMPVRLFNRLFGADAGKTKSTETKQLKIHRTQTDESDNDALMHV